MASVVRLQNHLNLGARSHLELLHSAHKSNIAIAVNNDHWNERCYEKNEALSLVETMPLSGLDSYVAQQATKRNKRRSVSNVACLSSFYVDLDTYNTQYNGWEAMDIVNLALNDHPNLPPPTIAGSSGRGCYLVWVLKF